MSPTPRVAAALAALLTLVPGVPAAPVVDRVAAQTPADSTRFLREARSAQAGFERLRFRYLPWTEGGSGGACDERIGRFCIWYGDDDSNWKAPPDAEPVQRGREELIARLNAAAAQVPGDDWIAGQRVRYLLEAGRTDEAQAAAAECRATRWWCLALQGLTLHDARRYAAADSAFSAALEAMPPREREDWTGLSKLLDGDAERGLRRLRRETLDAERRFWWLADPLWAMPGNDLRTEHYARHVLDQLQDRSQSTEGISWGDDLKEILLRFGQPVGWERIRPQLWEQGRASVVTHYAPRSWSFLPAGKVVLDPASMRDEDWDLQEKTARATYAPAYAEAFTHLEHQLALFRRGDSAVVVAAYALNPDSTPAGATTEAALVLATDERTEPRIVRDAATGTRGVLSLMSEPGTRVMSLETHTLEAKRIGRARYAVRIPGPAQGLALSDVLLLAGTDPLPTGLDDAIPRARGSSRVRPGESLGLFWEVYGLPETPDTVSFSVSMHRSGAAWGRRVAERLGLVDEQAPVRVRWEEETPGRSLLPRTLVLAIPDLPPGEYTLELSAARRGGEPVTVSRPLRVGS